MDSVVNARELRVKMQAVTAAFVGAGLPVPEVVLVCAACGNRDSVPLDSVLRGPCSAGCGAQMEAAYPQPLPSPVAVLPSPQRPVPARPVPAEVESLLGPLDLSQWARPMHRDEAGLPPAPDGDPWFRPLDHVIVGGESGPHARPCDVVWIERIVADFPSVFVKQLGSRPVSAGVPLPVRDPKGGDPAEWPVPLRVRRLSEVCRG